MDDTIKIKKSIFDGYEYKINLLTNGLKVLMIHNKNITTSCASMIVNVGTMMDEQYNDKTIFGLAHFLEHMVFMGSKKYPEGYKYFEYINTHGGKTNAFTNTIHTCFHFSIENEFFDICFDMFSHFFVDPLLRIEDIEKEINAVDSEYHKNRNIEILHYRQSVKLLSEIGHPYRNFEIGSNSTLKRNDIRENMINFYNKYYTSDNMQLVMISNKTFEEMIKMTENMDDIRISKQNYYDQFIRVLKDPFGITSGYGKMIKFIPQTDTNVLLLNWAIPTDINNKKSNTCDIIKYVLYLIGRESENSLSYILDKHNLSELLNVRIFDNLGNYIILCIEIQLTMYGIMNMDLVITIVLKYLEELKNNGINKENFESYNDCMKLNFNFEEYVDPVKKLDKIIDNICFYQTELINSGTSYSYICKCDDIEKKYFTIINRLCVDNLNIVFGSEKCIKYVKLREEWFDFEYVIENVNDNKLYNHKYNFVFEDMNKFNKLYIPNKLMIYKNKSRHTKPYKICDNFDV
jgi:insulysin